jgi:hypothetical protein
LHDSVAWLYTIKIVYAAAGAGQGAAQNMPLGHPVVHLPVENGTHADPRGKPCVSQSASVWQLLQKSLLFETEASTQKLLPDVVRKQTQLGLSLHLNWSVISGTSQAPSPV